MKGFEGNERKRAREFEENELKHKQRIRKIEEKKKNESLNMSRG